MNTCLTAVELSVCKPKVALSADKGRTKGGVRRFILIPNIVLYLASLVGIAVFTLLLIGYLKLMQRRK